jgi:hypothetical protein
MKNTTTTEAKKARNVFNNLENGPTPYLDTKGRRIRKSNNGALYTQNSEGNRNYKPTAVMIKPVSKNSTIKTITKETLNTIPKNIRPRNFFSNSNSNSNSNNNFNIQYHCRSCKRTYDGAAQCCFNLDHVQVKRRR